jgi:hypothetical protein
MAAAVLVASCATDLTPQASRVRIIPQAEAAGLEFVGQVTGTSQLAGLGRHQGKQNAVNDMLEKAAALGATHVVMTHDPRAAYWSMGQSVRGDAFRARR